MFGADPDEGKVEEGEDDEGGEVAGRYGAVGEGAVDVGEGGPECSEEYAHALAAPVYLGREPNAGEEDALDDDEEEAVNAPWGFLDDGEADAPFCSWGAGEDAEDTHEHVADYHRQHALPDVQAQCDER